MQFFGFAVLASLALAGDQPGLLGEKPEFFDAIIVNPAVAVVAVSPSWPASSCSCFGLLPNCRCAHYARKARVGRIYAACGTLARPSSVASRQRLSRRLAPESTPRRPRRHPCDGIRRPRRRTAATERSPRSPGRWMLEPIVRLCPKATASSLQRAVLLPLTQR